MTIDIIALAKQTIKYIETESYPRDIMALLNRIHTEATKLGENTTGLSTNELDAIERYGVYTFNDFSSTFP